MAISITPSPFGSVTVTLDGELGGVLSVSVLATSNSALNMDLGVPGPQGEAGEPGANGQNGVGVPVGGSAGQVLAKIDGTNYNTEWIDVASGDYLPLTGGTMTGDITFSVDGNGNDSLLGPWGFGVENTNGQVAYIQPDVFRIYDNDHLTGTSVNGEGITFNDSTVQTTAGLPLTGGTMTGTISGNGSGNFGLIGYQATDGVDPILGSVKLGSQTAFFNDYAFVGVTGDAQTLGLYANGSTFIKFGDDTIQTTAFPPAGGTSAEYIDGTGALQTFPTVTTAGKMVTLVRNNSGATITKGTVVYINGAVGNKPTIAKAQANSEATSKATYAFVEADIANNADGNVVQIGLLENIDTQGFSDGTQIFLSPTTAGGWTSTQPFSPYHYVRLGTVIRGGHPTQGSIAVNIINGFQLDEMSDVGAISPTNNNVLTWVSASSQWLDCSIPTILGYTPANVSNYSYATTAQAEAMTSTTTVVSPARFRDAYFTANISKPQTSTWLTGTTGTGGINDGGNGDFRRLQGPTSAANTIVRASHLTNFRRGGDFSSNIDWTKYQALYFRLRQSGADTNSTFIITLGEDSNGAGNADPAVRCVGIKFNYGGVVKILAHNGTTLVQPSTSYTPSTLSGIDFLIVSDGSGTVEVFANGTSIGTTTGGPTTLQSGTNQYQCINARVFNNSTPSGSQLSVYIGGVTAYTS